MAIPKLLNCFKFRGVLISAISLLMVGIFLCPHAVAASDITSERIIELTNRERIKEGAGELKKNEELTRAAKAKARSLLENQVFDHSINNKEFSEWIRETEYEYSYVGENLAMDFTESEPALRSWMESPKHRQNILYKDYRDIGVAVVEGEYQGQNSVLVVQIFGAPKKNTPENSFGKNNAEDRTLQDHPSPSRTDISKKTDIFWILKNKTLSEHLFKDPERVILIPILVLFIFYFYALLVTERILKKGGWSNAKTNRVVCLFFPLL